MKSTLIIILLAYGLFCVLLFLFQRAFLYFPQSASQLANYPEISIQNGAQQLSGWIINPGKSKALIYYGGNAEPVEYNAEYFERLLPEWSVYLVPYRGYGNNDGEPTESNLYGDALAIFDKLQPQYEQIALMGRSLGSGIATFVGTQRKISKMILVTPYDSITNVAKEHYPIFPVALLVRDKFESIKRAPEINVPVLMLIGEQDQIIRRERSEQLASVIKAELLTKVVISGAGHNDLSVYSEYDQAIVAFMR